MPQTEVVEFDFKQFNDALQQASREKEIDAERWISALEDAMASAAKKQHHIKEPVRSHFDRETGKFDAFIVKQVVEEVEDPLAEWTLEEAHEVDSEAEIGDEIHLPVSTEGLGRIAAQSAKQVLYQRIREAEREKIYAEYHDRVGEIMNGTVKRFERGDVIVDLGRAEAVVPRKEQARHERYSQGERVRAVVIDVHQEPKGQQIVLSRTDPRLLVKLFEMEVPEIYDGTVQIQAAVRAPGERAKVAVVSRERDVDPVGACVGMKGSRVQTIIRELRGEKIDIIEWSDDLVTLAQAALAPARITRVSVHHEGTKPRLDVIVEDEQLSLAIGRRGQNVRLASELVDARIDIRSESDVKGEVADALAQMLSDAMGELDEGQGEPELDLTLAPGVGAKTAEKITAAGFGTASALLAASIEELTAIEGVGAKTAEGLRGWAGQLQTAMQSEAPQEPHTADADLDLEAGADEVPESVDDSDFMAALSRALADSEESATSGAPQGAAPASADAANAEDDGDESSSSEDED